MKFISITPYFIRVSAKENFPIGTNMVLCGDMATQAKS